MLNLKEYVRSKIQKVLENNDQNVLIVLKGIDIKLIYDDLTISIDDILKNKAKYFIDLVQSNRNLITYDEYVALYDLMLLQYRKIIIIENNLYFNYFPLHVVIDDSKLNSLICHYDEEKEGEEYEIEDISELTLIYGNIQKINERNYVTYNKVIKDEKEYVYPLFEFDYNIAIEKVEINQLINYYEIDDEDDYLHVVDDLFFGDLNGKPKTIYILEKHTTLNKNLVEEKINILKEIFRGVLEIKIGVLGDLKKEVPVRREFLDILKTYWGFNEFKKIKVYDIDKLHEKEIKIKEVSQGEIIANIVEEVENCIFGKDYRDIFVTAPTGSGKSAMFQIPAIYLADKYELFTIVISPLIGLMKDQVNNLQIRNYNYARTINSDISPIQKHQIINDIHDKKCHILYLSPESLLSKSDLEQIIGDRTLGLLVVDEAHIVTTWGKQFRPDYWYLGDHLKKIKKAQIKKKGMGFVIATFTATAIYGGIENMYEETIQSLKMVDPITYLGFVKRDDIVINIEKTDVIRQKTEYELNKFDHLIQKIDQAMILDKKMLIYFPTVALLNRFWDYCKIKNIDKFISKYHGKMPAFEKEENYQKFLKRETPIMLATKAFGMGIDIDDIEIVAHFAPTGNVCDYVQEIGRAARRKDLIGEAYYKFMKNDFKHINKLHGLSIIKEYQLIEVIRKVYELYQVNIRNSIGGKKITKKRNEMLVDAENFAHIFESPFFDDDDAINKVKTAMLLIQKDFERKFAFSPFYIRPMPLFEIGFFQIDPAIQKKLSNEYGEVLNEIDKKLHICSLNLKKIWESGFNTKYSFPKFKYMLYTKDVNLDFKYKESIVPALSVNIVFQDNYLYNYNLYMNTIKNIINKSIREDKFFCIDGDDSLVHELMKVIPLTKYKAKSIIETLITAISIYQRDYSKNIHGKIFTVKSLNSGEFKYKFLYGISGFFDWIEKGLKEICNNMVNGKLYLLDDNNNDVFREKLLILGLLETFNLLIFKALGGKNSQIYIYVNQTKTLKEIIEKPTTYKNMLLELISKRHQISVEMLTYIFEGNFKSQEIWDIIESYFLGVIPEHVRKNYEEKAGKIY